MKRAKPALAWAAWASCASYAFDLWKVSAEPAVLDVPAGDFLGDDGDWTAFNLEAGTPGQSLSFFPSTSSSQLLVQVPQGCPSNIPDCASDRGGLFNSSNSASWKQTGTGTIDLEGRLNNMSAQSIFGTETVEIGSVTLKEQAVSEIDALDYWVGIMGVHIWDKNSSANNSDQTDLITSLKDSGTIPSLTFGYTAGANYILKGVQGSLTFGGYDQSRFDTSTMLGVGFADSDTRDLVVQLEAINTTINDSTSGLLSSSTPAYIDTTVTDLWLPLNVCQQFEKAFGIVWNSTGEFYSFKDATHQGILANTNPNVTFTLSDPADSSNSKQLNVSFNAFNQKAAWPRYNNFPNSTSYFPLRRASSTGQVTLGRAFFQEVYLFVNFENNTFTLSPALFSATAPSDLISFYPNGTTATSSSSSGGTSTPGSNPSSAPTSSSASPSASVIAPAVVVPIIALIALIGLFFCWRRRKAQRATSTAFSEKAGSAGSGPVSRNGETTAAAPATNPPAPTDNGELPTGPGYEIYEAASRTPDAARFPNGNSYGANAPTSPRAELGANVLRAEMAGSGGMAGAELPGDENPRSELVGSPVVDPAEVSSIPSPTLSPLRSGAVSPSGFVSAMSGSPRVGPMSVSSGSPHLGAASSPRVGPVGRDSPRVGSRRAERPPMQRNPSSLTGGI